MKNQTVNVTEPVLFSRHLDDEEEDKYIVLIEHSVTLGFSKPFDYLVPPSL